MPQISNPDDSPRGVRIAGRLPKQADRNGVAPLAADLIADPKRMRLAVVAFDVVRRIEDEDDGTTTSVIRILRIEPLAGRAERTGQKLLAEAATARTGDTLTGDDIDELEGVEQ